MKNKWKVTSLFLVIVLSLFTFINNANAAYAHAARGANGQMACGSQCIHTINGQPAYCLQSWAETHDFVSNDADVARTDTANKYSNAQAYGTLAILLSGRDYFSIREAVRSWSMLGDANCDPDTYVFGSGTLKTEASCTAAYYLKYGDQGSGQLIETATNKSPLQTVTEDGKEYYIQDITHVVEAKNFN